MLLSLAPQLLAACTLITLSTAQEVLNDTAFYGQSPYVEAPIATGLGNWADAYSKAAALVSRMTLEEKVNLTGGQRANNGAAGNILPVPRVAFPGMALADAGQGVRGTDFVSGFPSGLHMGAR